MKPALAAGLAVTLATLPGCDPPPARELGSSARVPSWLG